MQTIVSARARGPGVSDDVGFKPGGHSVCAAPLKASRVLHQNCTELALGTARISPSPASASPSSGPVSSELMGGRMGAFARGLMHKRARLTSVTGRLDQ